MLKSILIVGAGSFVGGALRYTVSSLVKPVQGSFPLGTFIVNVLGCLLIGLLYGLFAKHLTTSSEWCLLLTTGLCGGFTTFSTFSNETLLMVQGGNWTAAAAYVCGSIILGVAAVFCGYGIASRL